MISLPRLLNGDMSQKGTLHPSKTSISRNAFAISTAAVTLPDGEPAVKARDWIKLFDRYGTAGIFRVSRVRNAYGNQMSLTLKHGFCVLGDDTVKESEGTLTGTAEQIIRQLWAKTGVTEAPRYWTFGAFAQTPVITYEYSNPKLLTAVYDVLKKVPGYDFTFDQSVFPWTFSLVKLSDADACEGRFGRNLDSCIVDVDDGALCTRAYLDDRDGYTDAASASELGIVSETLSVPDGADDAAVQEYVQAYLRDHGEPYVSITLSGVDMSAATGEAIDRFETGSICRACLADYGVTVRSRIVTLETPDVYGKPDDVRVVMANRANTASDLLAKLRSSTSTLSNQANVTKRTLSSTVTSLRDTHRELVELDGKTTDRFSEVAITLDAQAARIDLMATREEVSELDYTLNEVQIALDAAEAQIQLKASQKYADEIATRVSDAEILIDGANAAIALKASQSELDKLTGRVTTAESTLTVQAGQIAAKASQYEVDALGNRVTTAESTLTVQASQIAGKVSQYDFDALGNRVTTAESEIKVQAGEISTKVSKDGVISSINQTAEEIRIQANRINLSGYVTASTFEAEIAAIENIFAGRAQADYLYVNFAVGAQTGHFTNMSILNFDCIWRELTMGELTGKSYLAKKTEEAMDLDHSHMITIDNQTGAAVLGGVTAEPQNFNIADTTFYKNAVSASYNKGKTDWSPVRIERTDYDTDNMSVTVRAVNAVGVPLIGLEEIDASEIYTAGYEDAKDDVTVGYSNLAVNSETAYRVRLTGTVWANIDGTRVASASINQTFTINPPSS